MSNITKMVAVILFIGTTWTIYTSMPLYKQVINKIQKGEV